MFAANSVDNIGPMDCFPKGRPAMQLTAGSGYLQSDRQGLESPLTDVSADKMLRSARTAAMRKLQRGGNLTGECLLWAESANWTDRRE